MAITPVSNLVATASDVDTVGLAWTNPDTYDEIHVQYNKGSGWVRYSEIDYSDTSEDVDDIVPNVSYNFRLRLLVDGEPAVYSNTDSSACWADTVTEEVVIDESITEYATAEDVSDTITETVEIADYVIDAKDIITNYVYYLGTATGGIYEYGGFYKSDAGTAITARWESKDTDFADQSIENSDKFKTVEFVRLHYIDKSAGARISIKVSTDGGVSWTTKTKSIGTGDSKGKIKDYYFVKTGQIFRFAIESISTVDEFQWVGLEVFYSVGGESFAA